MIASGLMACAAMVEKSDPDRFAATMAAPPDARARLWPLYAYNLELTKAAWASPEPLVCQMRLQWWIDTVGSMGQGSAPLAHEVAGPLDAIVRERRVPIALLQDMAEARVWDTTAEPFADGAALWAYLDRTAGNLMWAASLALGAGTGAETAVRGFATSAGMASWFCAVAALSDRNRQPLPDTSDAAISTLADEALSRIAKSRALARDVPTVARPALWTGWQARGLLEQARREPQRVLAGRLGLSEFARRGGLVWRAMTGSF